MQHVQQMQSCAFFSGKVNIIAAYTGDSDLAIVLGESERWLVVLSPLRHGYGDRECQSNAK
jgi:hypothetical protein